MTDSSTSSPGEENRSASPEVNKEAFKDLCTNNAQYFANDTTENGQRLYLSFMGMKDEIDRVWPAMLYIESQAHKYDFDESTPGNGYRSFIGIVHSALTYGIHINKKVCLKRDSVLFRKSSITREVEACAQLLASLYTCLKHLRVLMEWCPEGELFATLHTAPHELITQTEDINQYCFYGRPLGFQFAESIRAPLKFITLSMAIFSEAYYNDGSILSKATNSFMTTTKYVSDPEQRARRIVNINNNADVNFCKAFWFLSESELMQYLPSIVAPHVTVCKVINIPTEPISLFVGVKEIEIPIPMSHIGRKPVHVRLISYEPREGMIGEGNKTNILPPSRGLIIHCHGGGFVAQSSKSHETYLRQWAKELRVPILSIDYSLAPAAPYPRAHEEVLYAYAWAIKNCQILGSTGERIVAAGDSAGANLLTGMTMKCIQMGLPKPHGLFLTYIPTLVNITPSPARLLSKMDPLLPFGFLHRCIRAYIGGMDATAVKQNKYSNDCAGRALSPDTESFEEITESDLLELQAHKSPVSDMSDTLTYGSLTSQNDDTRDQTTIKDSNADSPEADSSQKFDLLDKFVLDSDTDTDGTKIAVITKEPIAATIPENSATTPFETSLQGKVSNFVTKLRGKMSNLVQMKASTASTSLDLDKDETNFEEVLPLSANPFVSPLLAADEILRELPPVQIITVHLDPCLDDCVSFGRKLKNLGNDIKFQILDGLPHGFLNFSMVCREAYDASKLCSQKISELLDLDNLPPLA